MKKLGACLLIAYGTLLCGLGSVFAVDFLKFEREFSGKGSTTGAFSPNIHIAFDIDGNIYVSDADNRLVQKLSPTGEFVAQIPQEAADVNNILKKPGDIAVDREGNIYVAEATTHHIAETAEPKIYMFAPCVYKFSPDGGLIHTYFVDAVDVRPKVALPARLMIDASGKTAFGIQPVGHDRKLRVAVNSQNQLYVLDAKMGRIHKFDVNGEKSLTFGRYGAGQGEFDHDASDIAIDTEGNIWIADTGNHRVVKFNDDGEFLLSFGEKGRAEGEFTKPIAIAPLATGEILVKDSSQFKRHLGGLPIAGVLTFVSPEGVGIADTVTDAARSRFTPFGQNPTAQSELEFLNRRIRLLEEAEYRRHFSEYNDDDDDKDENKKEEDEDLKAATIRATVYHNIIARVQRFDSRGNYAGRVVYEVDKQSEEEHDLVFLALDAFGHIYLRDKSELTIHQYSIEGFTIKLAHMNALYNARATNVDNNFTEDYEDIDDKTDLQDDIDQLQLSNALFWTYNLSERWNLMLADELTYGEIDQSYLTPPKSEDSYGLQTKSLTNTLTANLKFITNPNPYRYKELNLYVERLDGTSELNKDAIFQTVNKQRQEDTGDASSLAFGLNWDIFTRANLWLEYTDLNPAQTSRNYTRRFYDVSGDLYEVFGSRNQARQFLGELTIKF